MPERPKESDWKAYSSLVPVARERYLAKVNASLVQLLQSEDRTETESFWDAEQRIDEEAQVLQECLGNHSRSKMWMSVLLMLRYEMLTEADLEQFSVEFRDEILASRRSWGGDGQQAEA